MSRLERFIYKRSLFLITGLLAMYVSFNTPNIIERLLLIVIGSTVVSIVIKDTVEDKEP